MKCKPRLAHWIFVILFLSLTAYGASKPTYSKDVAPILNENCVSCHRPGQIAPMSLLNYAEVRPWAKSMARQVHERTMPPWHADPEYGDFENDRSLSKDEIETIVTWAEQGAKEGDPKDAPPSPTFNPSGWTLGEPDLIVTFERVSIPADGRDQFRDLVAPTGMKEDAWVTAVEFMPGDRSVVHHVILWQGRKNQQDGWIGAWGAGSNPMKFHKGTGRLLRKGVPVIADIHYHPSGEHALDQTRIGLHFADSRKDIDSELINLWVINQRFLIPPGARNHEVTSSHTFSSPSTILSLFPHMHYRGKDFSYTLTYPNGESKKLLQVSNYDFNWQTGYRLKKPLTVPGGTRIDCVAHFDNSTGNPDNPDPTRAVHFGNESYDEMMIGFVDYIPDDGGMGGGALFLLTSMALLGGVTFGGYKLLNAIVG